MTERDVFITWVQSILRDAEIAVHNGDARPRRAIWSQKDPVTVLGALKNATGQRELNELVDHLADNFSDCTSYEFELLEAEVLGDTAYTVGFEHTSASSQVRLEEALGHLRLLAESVSVPLNATFKVGSRPIRNGSTTM